MKTLDSMPVLKLTAKHEGGKKFSYYVYRKDTLKPLAFFPTVDQCHDFIASCRERWQRLGELASQDLPY